MDTQYRTAYWQFSKQLVSSRPEVGLVGVVSSQAADLRPVAELFLTSI